MYLKFAGPPSLLRRLVGSLVLFFVATCAATVMTVLIINLVNFVTL